MKWFLNLSTKGKLSMAFGLQFVLLALVIGMAYAGFSSIRSMQDRIFEREFQKLTVLDNIRSDLNRLHSQSLERILTGNTEHFGELGRSLDEKRGMVDDELKRLAELVHDGAGLGEDVRRLKDMQSGLTEGWDRAFQRAQAGKADEAREMALGPQSERNERIRSAARDMDQRVRDEVKASVDESHKEVSRSLVLLLAIGIGSLGLAVLVVALLNGAIAAPLNSVSEIADRIAAGDLTVNLAAADRRDEVGVLQRAFTTMVDRIRRMVTDVGGTINVLASTSSEIMATTAQVATGAAQTATAVSQTSTTVEEVKQTAHVASQKAKSVSDNAQKASQVAQGGRRSVEQSIEAMSDIREQMEMVAESTVKLSERSASIGEIIESVNDLAEQSNILAVNASIEAAKAGEAGRGFGVVAQEIRSLAEQSKQATTQVRNLLGEIQKGIGSAVMATEQVSRVIEMGLKQSEEMQESFRALADTVAESAQAALQISASSQQQLAGMDQVGAAMEGIRQASSQNLAGTKQSEASAQGLHKLGLALKEAVGRYKV